MCSTPHDLAVIFRAAMANPVFAQITAQPTAVFPTKTGDEGAGQPGRVAESLPRRHRRQDRLHRHRPRRRSSPRPTAAARRLVIAMMYGLNKEGGPTYWDQAAGLLDWGFALDPKRQHRRHFASC